MEDKLRHSGPGITPPNMSKMPAKKKSCFQITSVTQAQVAAVGVADDTESLDDPDESRTEDVSSEIYDMSRAEYEPACERSSSEEALNNVGEAEVVGVASSNAPQSGQSGLVSNAGGDARKVGVSGSSLGGQNPPGTGSLMTTQPPGVSVNTSAAVTSAAPPPAATSTVSCSSRFRVIKLDHGTGEPFRRGRWTCTEFYEKDSEASLGGRTVDSIRHSSVSQDPAADRDSGLGPSVGSVVSPVTHSGSTAEASLPSSRLHPAETLPPQQVLHQSYITQQHGVGALAAHASFPGVKPTAAPALSAVGIPQPHLAQNVLPIGQNGPPHPDVLLQKSPIMPPSYPPQQQVPLGHHMTGQSSGLMQHQTDYYQQQQPTPMPAALPGVQSLPVSGLSSGTVGQVPIPVMSPASGAASVPSQVEDVSGALGASVPAGHLSLAALQQQTLGFGGTGGSILVAGSGLPQQAPGQFPTTVQPQHISSGVQNVPAMAVGSSVPISVPTAVLSASSAAMPNVTTSSLPPAQMTHSITPMALGAQGLPVTGFGQVEVAGGVRKSEGIVNAQSPVVSGRETVKAFTPESLNLNTPTVNSLFGIHMSVDGEEDRNPSMAFYQAFQSGSRLRDPKVHTDSASGANIVAIDNKIEQAMDLVKSHLMFAVREEVEVLKEQIKELFERNSVLERENAVLKSLANSEQLSQLPAQTPAAAAPGPASSGPAPTQQGLGHPQLPQHHPNPPQLQTPAPQTQLDAGQQPNVTSA